VSRALIIHHGWCGAGAWRPTPSSEQRWTFRSNGDWQPDEAEVLRATPVLRVLADHEVTWLTSEVAAPLLWGNPLIERVLTSPRTATADLTQERFDLVLNLEPTPGCCALAEAVRTRRRAGFTWDAALGRPAVRPTRTLALPLLGRTFQDWLFALIDRRWTGERYVLGYQPRSPLRYDIGLCHLVAPHAPERAWPHAAWSTLRDYLRGQGSLSMPASTDNVLDFIDWVHACRTVVTGDGLGLHAALALGKRVVALFGPTDPLAVPLYGLGAAVTPRDGSTEMASIPASAVAAALEALDRVRLAG
jgi:heptosyltransferase-2